MRAENPVGWGGKADFKHTDSMTDINFPHRRVSLPHNKGYVAPMLRHSQTLQRLM